LRVVSASTVSVRTHRAIWTTVAAAAVLMVAGAFLHVALLRFASPVRVADSGDDVYSQIESGRVLRAGEHGGLLTLGDGSQVEMSPMAELSVARVSDDLRVRLASGTVLITAAKQKEGHHLYVETKDCLISVIGTVFQVNAEESGSRISVIEGEVHVQRGEISRTLVAGQQASTSPELGPLLQETSVPRRIVQDIPPAPPPTVKTFDDVVWAAPPAQTQTGNGVIRGVVKNLATGEGIGDVSVTLCPPARFTTVDGAPAGDPQGAGPAIANKTYFFKLWDSVQCKPEVVKTDSAGNFQFTNLADGNYTVTAERDGYVSPMRALNSEKAGFRWNTANPNFEYSVGLGGATSMGFYFRRASNEDRTQVTIDSQQRVAELSLSLVRGNFIEGHVRGSDGNPVINAVVRIVTRTPGTANDGPTATTALTDVRGAFRVYGLAPGDYRVGAILPNGLPAGEVWFSRSANPSDVTVLTLKDGGQISDIDIVLPR
jgi:hypothetical protein